MASNSSYADYIEFNSSLAKKIKFKKNLPASFAQVNCLQAGLTLLTFLLFRCLTASAGSEFIYPLVAGDFGLTDAEAFTGSTKSCSANLGNNTVFMNLFFNSMHGTSIMLDIACRIPDVRCRLLDLLT